MLLLDRMTAKQLFVGFLVFSAAVLSIVGVGFIKFQSQHSIRIFQDESIAIEVNAVRSVMANLLDEHRDFAQLIASADMSASIVMGSVLKEQRIADLFDQSSLYSRRPSFVFINVAVEKVFSEFELDITESVIKRSIDQTLFADEYEKTLLWEENGDLYFLVFQAIEYNGYVEGLLVTRTDFNVIDDFGFIVENRTRTVQGIPINGADLTTLDTRDGWVYQTISMSDTDIKLSYGIDRSVLERQTSSLISSLIIGLLFAVLLSVAVIFIVGKRWVMRPFVELARSETALSETSSQLKENQRELTKLANVARYAKDTVIVTTAEGITTWVNPSFEHLTGYSAEEVIGTKPGSLLQGIDTDPKEVEKIREALKNHHSIRSELLNYHKSGKAYWIEIEISPVETEEGEIDTFIAVERDITAQKETQYQLQKALEIANQVSSEKSTFIASISHEIRTPMNGVIGLIQLLKSTELNDKQGEYVDNLYDSVNHIISVLNQVLDYAKIESGNLSIFLEEFTLGDMMSFLDYNLTSLCTRKELDFALNCSIPYETKYVSDKIRINQIVLNLINNAVKHTMNGQVSVSVEAHSEEDGSRDYLRFIVDDTGNGLDDNYLNTMFGKDGLGRVGSHQNSLDLGLSIVKALTEMLNGRIEVRSENEIGTSFIVDLEVEKITQPDCAMSEDEKDIALQQEKGDSRFKARGQSVLVVEGDRLNAEVLAEQLTHYGLKPVITHQGQDALNLIYTYPYAMVIVDSHLPDLPGKRVVEKIRKLDSQMRKVLIFGVTADTRPEMVERLTQAGCEEVLIKPLSGEQLSDALLKYADVIARK